MLLSPDPTFAELLIDETRKNLDNVLKEARLERGRENEWKIKKNHVEPDSLIQFRQLLSKQQLSHGHSLQEDAGDNELNALTGLTKEENDHHSNPLSRVLQLTGFSDPLYAEAYVNVHRYDIVLEVMVQNRTKDTLQNVCLELATMGDLKLCERPQNHTIAPKGQTWISASIKVSSTETGIIFGNLVYDIAGSGANDRNCVVLNDIHIDIMDYISPAMTTEMNYRVMWAEFEWENKVPINSSIDNLDAFLQHILRTTNMKCLTPQSSLNGECGFLAANLYARSIFGEDALANVSVALQDNRIVGYIRIRSKTQGIALSLGDKITLQQTMKP